MLTSRPRGTSDIMPNEVKKWQYLERVFRDLCREYGYSEIRTPVFEHTELFERGVGGTTDIVEKEMYTFTDRGRRSITLRPEGTASAARAYLEERLYAGPQPVKLFYEGPMFRYDRPQAGRYRQFHQFGVEVFGSNDPAVDAEIMIMTMDFYRRLGLRGVELQVNSVGCPRCRSDLRKELEEYFKPYLKQICSDCRRRLSRNPLRIFDCKNEKCSVITKEAPTILECLCGECAVHFETVQRYLDLIGQEYKINPWLVRGLDYYTNTAFETVAREVGAQSSIGGGGRYNGLVETLGGKPAPGIGCAIGIERVLLAMEKQGVEFPDGKELGVFIATAGGFEVEEKAFKLLFKLRRAGIPADKDYMGRSLKAQMKYAGKLGVRFVLIAGEEEMTRGEVTVRDMLTGKQKNVSLQNLVEYVQAKLFAG